MEVMKKCSICGLQKQLSEFHKKGFLSNGNIRYNSQCKACHSIVAKNYYHNSGGRYLEKSLEGKRKRVSIYREQFIDYLRDKSCSDCGNCDIRVLEFDHLFDKKYNISQSSRFKSIESMRDEIKKCEIVCCNCHRIRTLSRINTIRK